MLVRPTTAVESLIIIKIYDLAPLRTYFVDLLYTKQVPNLSSSTPTGRAPSYAVFFLPISTLPDLCLPG